MANSGSSSPFPTSHDTIGASTLTTPLVMPSSPPNVDHEEPEPLDSPAKSPTIDRVAAKPGGDIGEEEDGYDARQREIDSPVLSRASSPDHAAGDLDARLANYSIDFSRFPSTQFGGDKEDDDLLPDVKPAGGDKLSEVGGPEDFTANLEKYLMGDDDDEDGELERKEVDAGRAADVQKQVEEQEQQEEEQGKDQAQEQPEQNSKLQQPTAENEAELGEYSEFGPPIDMSTPSHLLHRTAGGLGKDVTHLEGIEEGSDDEINTAATPSIQKQRRLSNKAEEEKNKDLHRQIADLHQTLQDRDEQLQKNHRRVLEAASAGEQIRHLQTELQRKSTLLDELYAHRSDEELLREQVQLLQKQSQEQELSLHRSTMNATDMSALQRQMADMQKELQKNTHPDLDTERLENIAHLRQQLSISQEQLKKRDATLDETMAKLREVATAKEQQLREKNTEIDGLRAQIDDQALEIEKLETDVDRSNTDYQTLEGRISSLETKNRPLQEKNSTLEADLTRAQSQVTAQESALKAMAADLPAGNGGQKTFTEILDLIKDLGPQADDTPELFLEDKNPRDYEIEQLRQEITKLQGELSETSAYQRTIEAELAQSREQAVETLSLFKSIEDENTRLTKRADELKSTTDRAQHELGQVRADHSAALQTIQRLQEEKTSTVQQPSPPQTPPTAQTHNTTTTTTPPIAHQTEPTTSLQTSHQTHLKNLQTAHANSTRKLQSLLSAAEKRESRLRTELQSLRNSRSTQDAQLESLSAEVQRLESALTVKDETAAELDERIARSVEKREKEWERRMDLLLKERDRMGRALMWTWGEKEFGDNAKENVIGENGRKLRQGYRYKYAQSQPQSRKRDGKRADA